MTDRELLERAAKAAGITVYKPGQAERDAAGLGHVGLWVHGSTCWNPLTDDGDALRLLVAMSQMEGGAALMLNSRLNQVAFAQCYTNDRVVSPTEYMLDDPGAATRRAIVRAAAEIGKAMP